MPKTSLSISRNSDQFHDHPLPVTGRTVRYSEYPTIRVDAGAAKAHVAFLWMSDTPVDGPIVIAPPVAQVSNFVSGASPPDVQPAVGAGFPSGARHVEVV